MKTIIVYRKTGMIIKEHEITNFLKIETHE